MANLAALAIVEGTHTVDMQELNKIAAGKTPAVRTRIEKDFYRHHVVNSLKGADNIGIELGVAGGVFSKRMVDSGKFKMFYGVDLYSDHHDTDEYVRALKHVGVGANYKLLRMSFDDALGLFDDDYFDFIYFDGYAHTGEEGGKSFVDWYRKVKVGGIIAGDDYHDDWPLVKWAVNTLAKKLDVELSVTGLTETTNLSHYPSWFFTKDRNVEFDGLLDGELFDLGQKVKESVATARAARPDSEVTLTVEQIFRFCDVMCERYPEKVPELRRIIKRHARTAMPAGNSW